MSPSFTSLLEPISVLAAAAASGAATNQEAVTNNGLYTWASFGTLTGAAAVTLLVSNSVQKAFDFNPKWLALLVAQAVSFFGLFATTDPAGKDFVLAFFNGFVIYSAAVGANRMTVPENKPPPPAAAAPGRGVAAPESLSLPSAAPAKRRFREAWF